MTLRPAKENAGITFVRTDLHGAKVHARAGSVCDTTLSTTLSENGVKVATVEHLLSALWGLGIDNLIVELSGEEVPIMDGSAAPFVDLIRSVGIAEQKALRAFIRIKREIEVRQGDAVATLKPYAGFKTRYTFVADHPVYNRYPKEAELDFADVSYVNDVSKARSFGLIRDLAQARAINRCLGSSLENAVGIDDVKVVNEEGLRYEDEFVKHKVLDAIGDLYLLGRPMLAEFYGCMSGHTLNNKLAQALLRCQDAWDVITVDHGAEMSGSPVRVPSIV